MKHDIKLALDWLKVEDQRKKLAYEQVAASEGLPPVAIEKDFWLPKMWT